MKNFHHTPALYENASPKPFYKSINRKKQKKSICEVYSELVCGLSLFSDCATFYVFDGWIIRSTDVYQVSCLRVLQIIKLHECDKSMNY